MVCCEHNVTFGVLKEPHLSFMQTILVVGAGKTSVYLINYLLTEAKRHDWLVIVADNDLNAILDKTNYAPRSEAVVLNITDDNDRRTLVKRADIVISLMPPTLHTLLAKDCLEYNKHLITASYISDEMRALHEEAFNKGLMFMCEMGLDPGIDHMTAHDIILGIQKVAGKIISFRSYTGGLIAPESDDNPWHYKFTWNPMNVVTAGSAGARYLHNGKTVNMDYEDVFAVPGKGPKIDGVGQLVQYPNRDSLHYRQQYELYDTTTFIRGTYRYKGFIKAWNILVQLGLTITDDAVKADTYADWIIEKNAFDKNTPLREQIAAKLNLDVNNDAIDKVEWLGILEPAPITSNKHDSASILLHVLQDKWKMKPEDKDLIVMVHEIEYEHRKNNVTKLTSTMVLKGENMKYSAMAKTVGLPMGILAKLILTDKITAPAGVHIPDMPVVYKPVLAELEHHGIIFKEEIR